MGLAVLALAPTHVSATDFTAGIVVTEMAESDRYPFVAGIVEGIAYSRYLERGKNVEAMKCVYNWFYEAGGATKVLNVYDAFKAFPDYPPGAVVTALVEKECGG